MPQIGLHRLILEGMNILRQNPDVLDDIFQYYTCAPMDKDYGQKYIDQIKQWFITTKIPVVQAWSMNLAKVPQISVQLAQESEAEDKASIGDFYSDGDDSTVGVSAFNVMLDVMIFGTKNSDEVLWLYYIVNYILFKRKRQAEALGLQLNTFTASDYARDIPKLPENVWVRTIRYRALVQNFWNADAYIDINDINVSVTTELDSGDVSISYVQEIED